MTALNEWTVVAPSNTWSRGARRKKARGEEMGIVEVEGARPLLEFRLEVSKVGEGEGGHVLVEAVWTRGLDRVAFGTLWAHLIRRVSLGSTGSDAPGAMDLS